MPQQAGVRALKVFEAGVRAGQLFRYAGDTIAMAPPFVSTAQEIGRMVDALRGAIRTTR